MTCGRVHLVVAVVVVLILGSPAFAQESDPHKLLAEADRLAWLRAWTTAEPLFTGAERAFAAQGDERNAMYARVSALRGRLPRLPVPTSRSVSRRCLTTFEEKGGKTLLVMHELYPPKEALDAAGTGAADAMTETFEQLDELLGTLGASVERS